MKKKKKRYKIVFTTRKDFSFILFMIMMITFFLVFLPLFIKCQEYMIVIMDIMGVLVLLSFLFNNKIILEKYFIRVNFGIFTYKIKYKDIKGLYIIDNHFLSLASSYHRIGIKTSKHQSFIFDIFVSPFDRNDFMEEVMERVNF